MKNIIYILFSCGILLSSCYEDSGNYDYHELNEILIEELPSSKFVCPKTDTLIIPVKITRSQGADTDYRFEWEVNHQKTLCNTQTLKYPVEFIGNDIPIRLKVTDQKTGVSSFAHYTLDAVAYYTRGLYALYEDENTNNRELAFLRMYPSNEGVFRSNLFLRHGFGLSGQANYAYVTFCHRNDPNGHIAILDGVEGAGRFTSFNTEFDTSYTETKQFIPEKAFSLGATNDLITGSGQLHGRDKNKIYGNSSYGFEISLDVYRSGMFTLAYYPKSHELDRYMNIAPGFSVSGPPYNYPTYKLPADKAYEMVRAQGDRNRNAVCIFKDKNDQSGQILVFQGEFALMAPVIKPLKSYTIPSGVWDSQSQFFVSSKESRIYYTQGNTIYYVNTTLSGFNHETLTADIGGGGEITALLATSAEDVFYVATYRPEAGQKNPGSIYVVNVQTGEIIDSYLNTTGKICNLAYKPQTLKGETTYIPKRESVLGL